MAESYSGWDQRWYSWGSAKTRCYVSASVENISDTQCRVSVSGCVQCDASYNLAEYGCAVQCGTGGASGTSRFVFDGGSGWHYAIASGVYDRGASAYSVKAWCSYWGETVSGYGACQNSGSTECWVSIPAIPVYAPRPITEAAAVRESDSKNALSWKIHADATHPYAGIYVDRQIDGGQWSLLADIGGGSTGYADASTSDNHSYRYRVIPHNQAGTAGEGGHCYTATLYNTPCAPGTPSASRSGEAGVSISLANAANTATSLELQRCTDPQANAGIVSLPAIDGKVTSASDSPGGGTFYYRARNARGALKSAWSAWSDAVVTICPPNAPTPKSPASGATVPKTDETVRFSWAHNPVDGSSQTAAQLRHSTDGGKTWTTVNLATEQSHSVANSFATNSTVTWQARTKGAHADWGPWSSTQVFYVKQVPSVVFDDPPDGFVLSAMPFRVKLGYIDASGSLANARLTVSAGGATVYERDMGRSTECDIAPSQFLPDNGSTYRISANVRSSSTLTASAHRDFSVSYVPPQKGTLAIAQDRDTGYVSLTVGLEDSGESAPAVSMSVYRVAGGVRKALAEGIRDGHSIVDMYAPLNTAYSYEVVTFAESGSVAKAVFETVFATPWFFFYFEGEVARGMWNPSESVSLGRPGKKRVRYAGRKYPVSYDSANLSEERSVSFALMDESEASAFARLVAAGGRCICKSADGSVFNADAECRLTPDYSTSAWWGEASIDLVRIEGGDL